MAIGVAGAGIVAAQIQKVKTQNDVNNFINDCCRRYEAQAEYSRKCKEYQKEAEEVLKKYEVFRKD